MAKINYSSAELEQMLDTAKYGTDRVIGTIYSRSGFIQRGYLNIKTITAAGWYRIATLSSCPYLAATLMIGGLYNTRRPTYAIVDVLKAIQSGSSYTTKWSTRLATCAGNSVSQIRLASDSADGSAPLYIDIYIPYAMSGSSGQSYFYSLSFLGPTDADMYSPVIVDTTPAWTAEYTLTNT